MFNIPTDYRLLKIFKTGFSSLLIKLISVAISFISVPMTLGYLGKERYGIWLTLTSVFALITFADLGLGNSLTNSIAKAEVDQSDQDAKTQVSNTFFTLTAISILLSCIFSVFAVKHLFASLFHFASNLSNQETEISIYIIAFLFIINLPLGVVQRIYEGYQKGYIYQYFLLAGNLISFILLFEFIQFDLGLPYLSFALLSSTLIANMRDRKSVV